MRPTMRWAMWFGFALGHSRVLGSGNDSSYWGVDFKCGSRKKCQAVQWIRSSGIISPWTSAKKYDTWKSLALNWIRSATHFHAFVGISNMTNSKKSDLRVFSHWRIFHANDPDTKEDSINSMTPPLDESSLPATSCLMFASNTVSCWRYKSMFRFR